MLSQICKELNNWFDKDKYFGHAITIEDGRLKGFEDKLQDGQYFRIVDSVFNDGVYAYGDENLQDEVYDGAVWAMAIPQEVIALADEIADWNTKYGGVDSTAMSPYQSESFGGYSYSKASGSSSTDGGVDKSGTWQGVFSARLNKWRKICPY